MYVLLALQAYIAHSWHRKLSVQLGREQAVFAGVKMFNPACLQSTRRTLNPCPSIAQLLQHT
jgi:hypothetical protein